MKSEKLTSHFTNCMGGVENCNGRSLIGIQPGSFTARRIPNFCGTTGKIPELGDYPWFSPLLGELFCSLFKFQLFVFLCCFLSYCVTLNLLNSTDTSCSRPSGLSQTLPRKRLGKGSGSARLQHSQKYSVLFQHVESFPALNRC